MARSDREGFRAVLTDRAFWLGLFSIVAGLVVFALLFNFAVMPIWTRHDAAVTVPNLENLPPGDAEGELLLAGLDGQEEIQPFNPNVPTDVVVDQNPAAGTTVKPGRRVYYYVNESPRGLVVMPQVLSFSQSRAEEIIRDSSAVDGRSGLIVDRVETDSIRTPYANTVTRQSPAPRTQVPVGTRVTLWISPGIDTSREVDVPDVVGLPVEEARETIREAELWADPMQELSGTITRQDPAAGSDLNPGQQVQIFVDR